MCGRFVATTAPQQLALLFDAVLVDGFVDRFTPNYNVAPTTQVLYLTGDIDSENGSTRRSLQRAHWDCCQPGRRIAAGLQA